MDRKSIVITGGSSGIGAALAQQIAGPARHLTLLGRDADRLESVAAGCRLKGATCKTAALDVRDGPAMASFLSEVDREQPVDLLIANAGILDGRHAGDAVETGKTARHVIETNLLATLDTVHSLLPGMRQRRAGDIILVASLASLAPLADAPAYSASKAGLLSYGIALRDAVAPEGVRVVVACPGFVATAMAQVHLGPRPGEISAEDAASLILHGLKRNQAIIGFPRVPFWFSRISLLMPEAMRRQMMRATRFVVGK